MMKKQGNCDMVIVDYLQLVDPEREKGKNREQEVSVISRKCKLIAKELDIPFVLFAQLNRAPELRGGDKRPQLSDLRESGAIEQDADVVIMLYRAEKYGWNTDSEGNSLKGKGELIIEKQRYGAVGTVYFGYSEDLTKIHDYDPLLPTITGDDYDPDAFHSRDDKDEPF
jgi:replicative DNA helicase